jgi:hypothetical protein
MKIRQMFKMVSMCIVLTSCNGSTLRDQATTLFRGDLEINFTDNKLDSVISEYVKKNEVDPKQGVLSLRMYRDPTRDLYFLTQVRRKGRIEGDVPDYFFTHNDQFLVLLYLGGSRLYTTRNLATTLDSAIKRLGIVLANDSLDYNPPLWEFMKSCDGKLQMRYRSDYIFNYLPCGYIVKQDSLTSNEFSLIKQFSYE